MARHVTTTQTNVLEASISVEGVEAIKNLVAYVLEKEKVDVDGTVGFDQQAIEIMGILHQRSVQKRDQ